MVVVGHERAWVQQEKQVLVTIFFKAIKPRLVVPQSADMAISSANVQA